jgi:hypothetical protein
VRLPLASACAGAAEFIEGTDRMKAPAYSPAVVTLPISLQDRERRLWSTM